MRFIAGGEHLSWVFAMANQSLCSLVKGEVGGHTPRCNLNSMGGNLTKKAINGCFGAHYGQGRRERVHEPISTETPL